MKELIKKVLNKSVRVLMGLAEDPVQETMLVADSNPFPERSSYIHADLGCFARPRGADYGIDLKKPPTFPEESKFLQCNLGFQKLPLPDESLDFVTAFDLLEHIPKVLWLPEEQVRDNPCEIFSSTCAEMHQGVAIIKPTVYLMNEIYRVLKPEGQFLSFTPAISRTITYNNINSLIGINQDPTHVSIWCYETFSNYFCGDPDHPEFLKKLRNLVCREFNEFKDLFYRRYLKSSSQYYEDLIIDRLLNHKKNGIYLDIGANDPDILSNTKRFYDRGWSGVNIEPDTELYNKLLKHRSRDINLNIGISSGGGSWYFTNYRPILYQHLVKKKQIVISKKDTRFYLSKRYQLHH